MGRVGRIGKDNGVGNYSQISLEQQTYSSIIRELENVFNSMRIYNINSNAKTMSDKYPTTKTGYFGNKGSSTDRRVIYCKDPVEESINFFNDISKGFLKVKQIGDTKLAYLPDGSIITYRKYTKTSKTGKSPAVDINVKSSKLNPKIKDQRIHFEEEK